MSPPRSPKSPRNKSNNKKQNQNQISRFEEGDWVLDENSDILMSHKKMKQFEKQKLQEIRNKSFGGPKGKLTSSEEILNRLKWDSQFPHDQFVIGYLDRFTGMMETTIEGYLDAEDVDRFPMHRIYYFKLNGNIVWDRESKIDLISTGEALKYVIDNSVQESPVPETVSSNSIQFSSQEIIFEKDSNDAIDENGEDLVSQSINSNDSNSEQKGIVFSNKRKRAYYQDYIPKDTLESYMYENNKRDDALKNPTHVSQRGGYYHIPKTNYEQVIRKWSESLLKKEEFYMEENRTEIFRLYIDIDFKTTDNSKVDLIQLGYLPIIQRYTQYYFKKIVPSRYKKYITSQVIVTECHGAWHDSITQDANFKSGYRLYFPTLFVNEEILSDFMSKLVNIFKTEVKQYHTHQPEVWTWEDVIDVKQTSHKRGRMFGTVKWRRGMIFGREYSFTGFYNSESILNKEMTQILRDQIPTFLQLTTLRYDEDIKLSVSQPVKILIFTQDDVFLKDYEILDMKPEQLSLADFKNN